MMVYVNMSADESQDLPMREANACGIPAVVFDCRGDYSDHCEFIKYGIVVNLRERNKCSKQEQSRFEMAMRYLDWYHFCTRGLKITAMIPLIPRTKFYDFPMSMADFYIHCKKKKIKLPPNHLGAKEWHENAFKWKFGALHIN